MSEPTGFGSAAFYRIYAVKQKNNIRRLRRICRRKEGNVQISNHYALNAILTWRRMNANGGISRLSLEDETRFTYGCAAGQKTEFSEVRVVDRRSP